MNLKYEKPTHIQLKNHPEFNEKWVQERIADDPNILGLGDLELRDVERVQPKAGRLDLLLRDPDSGKRYEVELMLGTVDESHIIRTLEYWDIERKRYPQYDHCAVIVAENVTSRFLNVIGLFNSAVPIIALQMTAFQFGESIFLTFAKVLDEIVLGVEDEEESEGQVTDRAYWEAKSTKEYLALADQCVEVLREFQPNIGCKYNKYYIGITENGHPNNFVIFKAKKQYLRVEVKIADPDAWRTRLEDIGLVLLDDVKSSQRLRIRLTKKDVEIHGDLLRELFQASYEQNRN
jgi:hypothetical protein